MPTLLRQNVIKTICFKIKNLADENPDRTSLVTLTYTNMELSKMFHKIFKTLTITL